LAIAVWCFGSIKTVLASNEYIALFWGRFLYVGALFIPSLFLHFTETLLNKYSERKKKITIGYFLSLFFLVLNCTDLFIKDVAPKPPFRYYDVPGVTYPFFIIFFFFYIIHAHYDLVKAYKNAYGIKRNQIKYLLLASLFGFGGGASSIPIVFKEITSYPFTYPLVVLYPIIVSYAIVKHRLMDINIIFKKGVTYAYASFLLLIPIFILFICGQKVTFKSVNYPFSIFMLGAIVAAAYFFPKVKVRAEKTVEQFIFKNKYDYKKTISDLSKAMVSILNTNDLCKEIVTTTTDALMVGKASIYMLDEERGFYELYESMGLKKKEMVTSYHKEDPFFRSVEEHKEIFIREELERYANDAKALAVVERMNQMESEICIPLITKQKLMGIINLGMKGRGEMYTHEDLELLSTLSNQAATAIENAKLYEDISRARVQMQRADRLASLGTLTAGLAHEIRNPLVAIKTFTQLLPERFDDDEFRNHFLNVTAGEVDRISSLVNELLEFARPSQPNLNKENLNQIVEKMLLLVATESHKKNLQIIKEFHPSLPSVVLDKEQIKQVFLNILLNAIDATPENGTITVRTKPIERNGYQEYVQIIVRDTGKGIPKVDLDRIFTPFYTTKHQGSGLGLAISHQIVQEHHGSIEVESSENQGTAFYITLSVNPMLTQEGKQ
jgi:signal transduction histidine kinase